VEICARLGITARTVRGHIETVKKKLGVLNRVQAVARRFEFGMLSPVRRDR
jgi:DNA-binding CsgD family transcriptional regulator